MFFLVTPDSPPENLDELEISFTTSTGKAELLPVSEAGSFGFSPGGPLISPNEPHFVCSFQLGQGWLRYLAD